MSYSAKPLAVSLPVDDPPSASLRTMLQDIPMLPAPTNVEDLLARLDAGAVPFTSRPFSAIVSDACGPDDELALADTPEHEEFRQDGFFAPVSQAANTNVAPPAPSLTSRSRHALPRLARGALVAGALLTCSTALLTPDVVPTRPESPPPAPSEVLASGLATLSGTEEQRGADQFSPDAQEPRDLVQADETLASVEPTDLAESKSEPESIPWLSEPVPEASMEGDPRGLETERASANAEAVTTAPSPPIRPGGLADMPFAGVWAVSAEACTPAMQRQGYLLADINAQRARAGRTTCTFSRIEGNATGWDIAAVCSSGRKTWKSDVRLSLERGRLTWTSRKGVETYVRCQGT